MKKIEVTFTADFNWRDETTDCPTITAYKAGMVVKVSPECAKAAKAAGVLKEKAKG